MKYEWKKEEKDLYLPKQKPALITISRQKYFTITGKGNPNEEEFSEKIGILYSLSYAVKIMPKKGFTPNGYFEYTVYPLEGIWDLSDEGKKEKALNKDELVYKIMIRQPDFVNEEVVDKAFENVKKKSTSSFINDAKFEEIEDGLCLQMLHIGSYDEEFRSFEQMKLFAQNNNLVRKNLTHKEIYLSDFRKVEKDKLKTVLRYFVKVI